MAVNFMTEEVYRISMGFAVLNVRKLILCAEIMRFRSHSMWLDEDPNLIRRMRRIALNGVHNIFYFAMKVKSATMHAVEEIEMPRKSPELVSIPNDFTQQKRKWRQRRERGRRRTES